jgi:hypothetical protein
MRRSTGSYARLSVHDRMIASLIWGAFLVFVFVAGFASRIWLR